MGYLYQVRCNDPSVTFGWPASRRERARLEAELLTVLEPALQRVAALAERAPLPAAPLLADFLALYATRPLAQNKGGSGLNDSLWLYLVARLIDPALVVESGTWRGQSAWLLRRACPAARIATFDVAVPEEGRCETAGVSYHLSDWMAVPLACPPGERALVFFDDHISHAQRLAEAAARGYRLALFDDNFAARHLHATGAPPVPTLAMLLDPETPAGTVIEWQRNGKIYRYDDSVERRRAARDLVAGYLTLPELASVTHHPPGSGMTLVRLRDRTLTGM